MIWKCKIEWISLRKYFQTKINLIQHLAPDKGGVLLAFKSCNPDVYPDFQRLNQNKEECNQDKEINQ